MPDSSPRDDRAVSGGDLQAEQAHWLQPAVIRAHLKTAGEVPDPLLDEVFGKVIESAEGVTTFAGYAAREGARERVRTKLEALASPHPSDAASEEATSWE